MAWSFTSNPFISMYGPLFLVVYYVLVIALWQLTKALLKNWPRLPKETLLPNANISPCFIALLMHRKDGVLLQGMGVLLQRGYLEKGKKLDYYRAAKTSDSELEDSERRLLAHFSKAKYAFTVNGLIDRISNEYEQQAREEGLILSERQLRTQFRIALGGGLLIFALAVYKIWVALMTGHSNVLFLAISAPILAIAYYLRFKPRDRIVNSPKGRALLDYYLTQLSHLSNREGAQAWLYLVLVGTVSIDSFFMTSYARHVNSGSAGSGGDGSPSSSDSGGDSGSGGDGGGSGCGGCGGGD